MGLALGTSKREGISEIYTGYHLISNEELFFPSPSGVTSSRLSTGFVPSLGYLAGICWEVMKYFAINL